MPIGSWQTVIAQFLQIVTSSYQALIFFIVAGQIDNRTLEVMNLPRCGVSDKLGTERRFAYRKKRYNLQGIFMNTLIHSEIMLLLL